RSTSGSSGKSTPARRLSSALLLGRSRRSLTQSESNPASAAAPAISTTSDQRTSVVVQVGRTRPRRRRSGATAGRCVSAGMPSVSMLRSMGQAMIPPEMIDLLESDALAHLATLRSDGTPHVTPLWIDHDGNTILVDVRVDR